MYHRYRGFPTVPAFKFPGTRRKPLWITTHSQREASKTPTQPLRGVPPGGHAFPNHQRKVKDGERVRHFRSVSTQPKVHSTSKPRARVGGVGQPLETITGEMGIGSGACHKQVNDPRFPQ
jgi:hypothetical protein